MQTHQPKKDKIADSLDLTPIVNEKKEVTVVEPPKDDQTQRDLDYSRENLYHLVERGRDALEGILDLAQQSQSPRAYEVAGQLIDLQKKAKELFKDENVDPKTINNNLFVGNTSELTKLLGGTARDVPSGKSKL